MDDVALGTHELAKTLGVPTALRDSGVIESDLDPVAEIIAGRSYRNPEHVTAGRVQALLRKACEERPPERV